MKKKAADSNMPTGNLKRIKDFLPSPEDLVINEETKKITISLKQSSINFFKCQATRYHTKYQKMIRELLDKYAEQYSDSRN
ncbi:MAG: CopG family transcriptional regulator [Candidatus Omnitrophota bacterium]